jgi:hypothetical protein
MTTMLLPVPVDGPQGLVPVDLIAKAREYARASKSPARLKVHDTEWRTFTSLCAGHEVCPLRVTAEVVAACRNSPQCQVRRFAAFGRWGTRDTVVRPSCGHVDSCGISTGRRQTGTKTAKQKAVARA